MAITEGVAFNQKNYSISLEVVTQTLKKKIFFLILSSFLQLTVKIHEVITHRGAETDTVYAIHSPWDNLNTSTKVSV